MSFPRRRESSIPEVFLDSRLRGSDEREAFDSKFTQEIQVVREPLKRGLGDEANKP